MCAIFMKMASAVLTLQYNMARGSVTAPKGAKRRISLDFYSTSSESASLHEVIEES